MENEIKLKSGPGWKTFAGAGAFCALLAGNGFLMWRTSNLESQLDQMNSSTRSEMTTLKESSTQHALAAQRSIADLNQQLEQSAARARNYALQQARLNADRAAAKVSKQTEDLLSTLTEQQKKGQAEVVEQIGAVKQASERNSTKVGEVASEVTTVKTEIARTKSELESTIADLRSVRGDLGIQSGLIATNSKELDALKALGERNYHEFSISRANGMVKLASVAVTLKKADLKRNKFNLELNADDKRIEKKDKTVNEPVQFYVAGQRQPYEIVVNEVGKDRITGYLSTPRVIQARR